MIHPSPSLPTGAAGAKQFIGIEPSHRGYRIMITREYRETFAIGNRPHAHALIRTPRHEVLAIGGKTDASDPLSMPVKDFQQAVVAMPQPHASVPTPRHEVLAIGGKTDARDRASMPVKDFQQAL